MNALCLFCGDPCPIRANGVTCTDCDVYAHWNEERGRWMVYLPTRLVPFSWIDTCGCVIVRWAGGATRVTLDHPTT
jgi:hypothetical protein